jgi:hypothetical protein
VVRAAALLSPDVRDGVVRHLTSGVCVLRHPSAAASGEKEKWLRVPSVAEAAVNGDNEVRCDNREPEEEPRVILFQDGRAGSDTIRTMPARDLIDKDGKDIALPETRGHLNGAYVLIGQTHPDSWMDQHLTPLGMMPGVLVNANALYTVTRGGQHFPSKLGYEAVAIVGFSLLYACISTFAVWLSNSKRDKKQEEGLHIADLKEAFVSLTAVVAYFIVAATGVSLLWSYFAADALEGGYVMGTFVPMLTVGLESIMEAGDTIIKSTRKVVGWGLSKVAIGAFAIVFLLGALDSGRAEEKVGTLQLPKVGADVEILRNEEYIKPPGLVWDLQSFDTVLVRAKIDVVVMARTLYW